MTGSLVALLVAAASGDGGLVDAGVPAFDSSLYATCPEAPPLLPLDGGWYLSTARGERLSCLMATCEADRSRREKEVADAAPPLWWVWVTTAAVLAAGTGFAVGWFSAPRPVPTGP